jgi:cytoskeletal protein CcmA (bactofilin family)
MRQALPICMAIVLASVVAPAAAIEFRSGQHVVVAPDEVISDDLYVTGETVTIDGKVEGDVIASGREVRLNGEVTGDFMAAGQAVMVNGHVGDDLRMAGMTLWLGPTALVVDDIVSAGFSLETDGASRTEGSLVYAGFQALLRGVIEGGLFGAMSAIEIRSRIGGDSEITVDGNPAMPMFARFLPSPVELPAVAGGLTIGEEARIEGSLEYISANEARVDGTTTTLTRREPHQAADSEIVTRKPVWPGRLSKLISLIVLGALLAWRFPSWLGERTREIHSKPLLLVGLGLVGIAGLPVLFFLALSVTILLAFLLGLIKLGSLASLAVVSGLVALGLLALLVWVTLSYIAPLLVGLCTGQWVMRQRAEKASHAGTIRGFIPPLVAGLFLLALLRFVPILGTAVTLGMLLIGSGAILFWLWSNVRPRPTV